MQNIRIVNIPEMKAVYSGPLTDGEKFEKFNHWFSCKQQIDNRFFHQYVL